MATSRDFQVEGSVTGYDDEDVRGDGRKKKFKPLSAMRKFFTKRKDKKDSVVAVKAKSTTAIPSEDDEDDDDDDGGFKAHSKRSVLAGNRSLSEDSIFSTEPRGQPIAAFPKAALSEESLPRSAFQSELMSKLNKRRSEYLDDDQDDGLPHSPVPAVTTVDVILGEPLKKQIGQSGKTSSNRDSDQSLISVDSSENEEEELFLNKWKSSVPARKSATLPATSTKTMDALDFNSIQKTELLASRAAKHKITVKPARKKTRQSIKKRDTSSPSPLPSLNEESPTSSKHEDVKEVRISEKVTPSDEKPSDALPSQTSYTAKEKIGAQVAADSKSKVSAIALGSKSNTGSPLTSPTSPLPPATASTAAVSATLPSLAFAAIPPTVSATLPSPTAVSATVPPTVSTSATSPTATVPALPSPTPVEMATSPVSPTARFPPQTGSISDSSHQSLALATSSNHVAASVAELTAAPKVVEKKIEENLSLSEKGVKTIFTDTQISVKQLSQSQKGVTDSKFDTDIKSRMSQFQMPSIASSKTDTSNSAPEDSLSMKVTNADLTSVEALKEESKVKHQIRSRTLPSMMGEQSSSKVQRSRSHRIPNSGADFPEPRDNSAVLSDDNIILSSASVSSSSSLPDTKKSENVKVSSTESKATVSASEPSWLNMVRRKKSVQEQNIEIEKVKPDEAAATRTGLSSSAPKSIFSSTSYLEKKRGSTETVSFKNRELSEATVKKVDTCETKSQSLDLTAQNKPTATELSSSKKETIEVEVSNLGSVKASRSIFDSSSKSVGQRDSVLSTSSTTSTAVERIRKFSSTSSAISGSGSAKAASNTSQDLPVAAPAVASEVKSAAPSSGITHTRSGSVKTSLSKTSEVKSSIYTRSGSIKASSALSATSSSPSSEPTASAPVKAETVSALKPDSLEASTAPPSASPQPSAQHVPAHVSAQPNPSLPSQTPSVTPLTFFVQPFHAYSSKPLANTALATKPAYAAVQPYSKLACTPINSTAQAYPSPKPALIAASSKSVSVPNVKLLTSTSISANSPFALPNVSSSSSTNSTNLTPSSSALSSSSLSSSTRAHSSITASTASKSHSSHMSHLNCMSTSSIKKSPSFKTAATSSEKVIPFQKVVVIEKPAADVKKLVTSAKVPAWRTNLPSKEVKIEIIENSPSSAPTSSSQTSSENLRKPQDKVKLQETTKKTEGSSGAGLAVEAEKSTRRTSKVLDMVKNFQNLQAPS